jgi:hypothetical protein
VNLQIIQPTTFSCARTCRPYIECKFGPIMRAVGSTKVVSHTVRVSIELSNHAALAAAVLAMGGAVLGIGQHKLFNSQPESGFGFTLPSWRHPLVLKADGKLAFDDYGGKWGNTADIEKLKGKYAVQAAMQAAAMQGWQYEYAGDGSLLVHHPDGGVLTVTEQGVFDVNGMIGTACDAFNVISNAVGSTVQRDDKCEYFLQEAHVVAPRE